MFSNLWTKYIAVMDRGASAYWVAVRVVLLCLAVALLGGATNLALITAAVASILTGLHDVVATEIRRGDAVAVGLVSLVVASMSPALWATCGKLLRRAVSVVTRRPA